VLLRCLHIATLVAVSLAAAAVFLGLHPETECWGVPGESDFLDNPYAYHCDVSTYELVVYAVAGILLLATLVVALIRLIWRLGHAARASKRAHRDRAPGAG
jgi:hypothetical protein